MWKYTWYCQKGLSHVAAGRACQDAVVVKEDAESIVAALSDGLGSLRHSEIAAAAATNAVCEWFAEPGRYFVEIENEEAKQEYAKQLLQTITIRIKEQADLDGIPLADMDCTLVFVYISKQYHYAIAGQLGDSAVCIIKENESLVLNEGNSSANGTNAVLDMGSYRSLNLVRIDMDADDVCGFLLTSDGLENEIYQKGSSYVNKAAEYYFNVMLLAGDSREALRERILALTAAENTIYDDDISLAVISRAGKKLVFPEDPTWLCSCGTRNPLRSTYCANCSKDFVRLYQNVRFKDYGGKYAFFREINKNPEKEYEVLEMNGNGREKRYFSTRKSLPWLSLTGAVCFAAGAILGAVLVKNTYTDEKRLLMQQIAEFQSMAAVERETVCDTVMQSEPAEEQSVVTEAEIELVVEETTVPGTVEEVLYNSEKDKADSSEREYISLADGSGYWGVCENGMPNGQGMLLQSGFFYIGTFREGEKNGEFLIVPECSVNNTINVVFENNALVEAEAKSKESVVCASLLNVQSQAGVAGEILWNLESGDIVYETGEPFVQAEGKSWTEIICSNGIGWVETTGLD